MCSVFEYKFVRFKEDFIFSFFYEKFLLFTNSVKLKTGKSPFNVTKIYLCKNKNEKDTRPGQTKTYPYE